MFDYCGMVSFLSVMKSFLHLMLKVCGYQKDNVSNQREHIIHLLANEQSRLHIPEENELVNLKSLS